MNKKKSVKTNLKNSKNTKIVLGIFALILLSAVFVYALAVAGGYKISSGAQEKIDKYNLCRYVKNNYPLAIFVPTNSALEWNYFVSRKPLSIVLSTCCGDDVCDGGENEFNCAEDCGACSPYCVGAWCGDDDGCGGECVGEEGLCGYLEECTLEGECVSICSSECISGCPDCCGNGVCDTAEDFDTCSLDCDMTCADCLNQCDILYCDSVESGDICYGGIGSNCAEMCAYCQMQCMESLPPPC